MLIRTARTCSLRPASPAEGTLGGEGRPFFAERENSQLVPLVREIHEKESGIDRNLFFLRCQAALESGGAENQSLFFTLGKMGEGGDGGGVFLEGG